MPRTSFPKHVPCMSLSATCSPLRWRSMKLPACRSTSGASAIRVAPSTGSYGKHAASFPSEEATLLGSRQVSVCGSKWRRKQAARRRV